MQRKFKKIDFVKDEFKDSVKEKTENEKLEDLLLNSFIDNAKEYKEPPIFLGIKDDFDFRIARLCTPGNISAITGKAKSKKTFFQTMLAAAATINQTLFDKIVSNFPESKRQVLIFDTEQSVYDVWRVNDRIKRLCNQNIDNLGVFSFRGLDAKTLKDLLIIVLKKFPQTGIIFIDQIADFTKSINSEEEAVELVRFLEKITKDYNIHINCVIHQNKGDNFASGWLGTQIMKKAETVISVEKELSNKDVSHIIATYTRSIDFEPFSIRINTSGLPEILGKDNEYQKNEI